MLVDLDAHNNIERDPIYTYFFLKNKKNHHGESYNSIPFASFFPFSYLRHYVIITVGMQSVFLNFYWIQISGHKI